MRESMVLVQTAIGQRRADVRVRFDAGKWTAGAYISSRTHTYIGHSTGDSLAGVIERAVASAVASFDARWGVR